MTYVIRQLRRQPKPRAKAVPDPHGWVIHRPGGSWDRTLKRGIYRTREAAAEALAAEHGLEART